MQLIGAIANSVTNNERRELVQVIIERLGAETYSYITILPPKSVDEEINYSFCTNCTIELCDIYRNRMWHLNDPFLEYARTNSQPALGSEIDSSKVGQSEIIRLTQQRGFRSGIVIPTHTAMGSNKRMGVLYVGSDLPPEIGEPILLKGRMHFILLGVELLLWWNKRLKQQAMRKYSLVNEELELLNLSKKKYVAADIALLLNMKVTHVYKKLNLIKEKLDSEKIEHAVMIAESVGLLE